MLRLTGRKTRDTRLVVELYSALAEKGSAIFSTDQLDRTLPRAKSFYCQQHIWGPHPNQYSFLCCQCLLSTSLANSLKYCSVTNSPVHPHVTPFPGRYSRTAARAHLPSWRQRALRKKKSLTHSQLHLFH